MGRIYAEETRVPVEQSRGEIEKLLKGYGADQFMSGWSEGQAMIAFRLKTLHIKLMIPMPVAKSDISQKLLEKMHRQRWRAIVLIVKAKLESVRAGIRTLEQEFLDDIVMPGGATFGTWARPQIAQAYKTGKMPTALPMLEGPKV